MNHLAPISIHDFLSALRHCRPPNIANPRIAVAYSGGPDSTCLLWLLHQLSIAPPDDSYRPWPLSVIALSVDHSLQEASTAMAEHCTRFTRAHNIPHVSLRIPWASADYPARPVPEASFERIARDARQRLFLDYMDREDIKCSVLATGHHLDDQVETLLMGRVVSAASSQTISSCRRWGMGDARPARILATCEEHRLEYVVDKTNFQPDLTRRNTVRHALSKIGSQPLRTCTYSDPSLPSEILNAVENTVARHTMDHDENSVLDALYSSVGSTQAENRTLQTEALNFLAKNSAPSPPSTALILTPECAPEINLARVVLHRVLRQISPFPWGSIASQGHRNHAAIDRLAAMLWGVGPVPQQSFTSASLVLWTPVVLRPDGSYRRATPAALAAAAANDFRVGWLASRAPPEASTVTGLALDITDQVAMALQNSKRSVDVLFDCRFSIEVILDTFVDAWKERLHRGDRLVVSPDGRFTLPRLHWQTDIRSVTDNSDTLPQDVEGSPIWQYKFIRPV